MKRGHGKRRAMWIMEELAAHRRAAAFKHVAAATLWPWSLFTYGKAFAGPFVFLAGCYNVTHSLLSLATVSFRGCETEEAMTAGILKRTHSIYFTGFSALRATVVSWSEDNCENTCSMLLVTCGPLSVSWSLLKAWVTHTPTVTHTHDDILTPLPLCFWSRFIGSFPHRYVFIFLRYDCFFVELLWAIVTVAQLRKSLT